MNRRISKRVPSTKKQSKKSVNTGLLEASGDSSMTPPKSTNLRISTWEIRRRGPLLVPWNWPGDSSKSEQLKMGRFVDSGNQGQRRFVDWYNAKLRNYRRIGGAGAASPRGIFGAKGYPVKVLLKMAIAGNNKAFTSLSEWNRNQNQIRMYENIPKSLL